MSEAKSTVRLHFLDWFRGLGAVIMLQGHTFDAFTPAAARQESPYVLSQFFGGLTPAIFLFLTGITFAMGMDRGERQRLPWHGKMLEALKRARYLLVLAVLFRVQMYVFALPGSSWTDLLKVDILNAMGITMALLAFCAILETERRARVAAGVGIAIAALSPVISSLDFSAWPQWLSAYIVPSHTAFAIFPWSAFLAFGVAAGSAMRMIRAQDLPRAMQWSALLGFGLLLGGQYFSNLPFSLYSNSDFWLNSPMNVACKTGLLLLLASFAYFWTEYLANPGWSWIRQLGTTSLAVYWVHIELVYGRWFESWKSNSTPLQITLFSVGLIAAMVAMSMGITRWRVHRAALRRERDALQRTEALPADSGVAAR